MVGKERTSNCIEARRAEGENKNTWPVDAQNFDERDSNSEDESAF